MATLPLLRSRSRAAVRAAVTYTRIAWAANLHMHLLQHCYAQSPASAWNSILSYSVSTSADSALRRSLPLVRSPSLSVSISIIDAVFLDFCCFRVLAAPLRDPILGQSLSYHSLPSGALACLDARLSSLLHALGVILQGSRSVCRWRYSRIAARLLHANAHTS